MNSCEPSHHHQFIVKITIAAELKIAANLFPAEATFIAELQRVKDDTYTVALLRSAHAITSGVRSMSSFKLSEIRSRMYQYR